MDPSELNTANAQQLMNTCLVHGGAAWDPYGRVRALEIAANFQISPTARSCP